MIEFNGKISKKCQNYICKQEAVPGLIGCLIGVILVLLPATVIASIYFSQMRIMVVVCGILLSAVILFFGYYSPFMKGTLPLITPIRIVITDNGEITSYGENFELANSVADATVVVDYGEWYHISFTRNTKIGLGNGRFVCQKDLLTQGSIEQFEKLFEGKIVRKYK